jgi:hypothetical protein
VSKNSIHVAKHSRCDQGREGIGDEVAAEEDGVPLGELTTRVPFREDLLGNCQYWNREKWNVFRLTINAPGRNAASTKPRKNRVATMPAKLCVTPERVETIPQRSMMIEMYSDGRLMVLMNMLEGTCIKM